MAKSFLPALYTKERAASLSQAIRFMQRNHAEEEDASVVSKQDIIPSATIIKQLATAVGKAKNWNSMRDLPTSSFSVVKSLVLREKDKSTSGVCDDVEIHSLICLLFNSEEHMSRLRSVNSPVEYLPRDIYGAPPESFVVRLSNIIGSLKSEQKMASFWLSVVAELRRLWSEGKPIPHVPLDDKPDLNSCHLYQQLQVINCCIARKERRAVATKSLDSLVWQSSSKKAVSVDSINELSCPMIYARNKTGDVVLRLGAGRPSKNLTMLETDEHIYSPVTQEGPILTEEFIRESEEFVLRTGSLGAGCSQLLSDMQAFKAANPGCILEDFVRWHSPPDWTEAETDDAEVSYDDEDLSLKKGRLSRRMQKEGNLWRELWETAKALPAVKQTPLFDEDLAVECIFAALDEIAPSELFKQLFVSTLFSSLEIAEAALSMDSNLFKLFCDCKDYIFSTCQSGISSANLKDICKVYENIEMIILHPEEATEIVKQSEGTSYSEMKNLFKIFNLKFASKDGQDAEKGNVENQKKIDEKGSNKFSNLFDGKTSLFKRKNSKPDVSASQDENDWTIL